MGGFAATGVVALARICERLSARANFAWVSEASMAVKAQYPRAQHPAIQSAPSSQRNPLRK